jgi:uncharacterized membrane protein
MKKNILTAVWFTLVTTVIFGVIYPLAVTGMAQLLFSRPREWTTPGEKRRVSWLKDDWTGVH